MVLHENNRRGGTKEQAGVPSQVHLQNWANGAEHSFTQKAASQRAPRSIHEGLSYGNLFQEFFANLLGGLSACQWLSPGYPGREVRRGAVQCRCRTWDQWLPLAGQGKTDQFTLVSIHWPLELSFMTWDILGCLSLCFQVVKVSWCITDINHSIYITNHTNICKNQYITEVVHMRYIQINIYMIICN